MTPTREEFAKSIIAFGLASAEEMKTLWQSLPPEQRPKDAAALAKLLVEKGQLTKFQAKEILSRSGTPLVLGEYVLLDTIGAGGMGQVFKAQHRRMKRLVAIKLLPPALTNDAAAVKRFEREVEAAAKLSHPNIVQAHDAGVQQGVWYLVMEFVEGLDLSALVKKQGSFSVTEAVDYVLQAARGLEYAHDNGVIHRDIKPANLLLDKKSRIKILDMGLARLDGASEAADQQLTGTGQIMGTVDYMAPEQALNTKNADARSDLYSLGITLWYLLTGKAAYAGETAMEKLMAHQTKPIPSLVAQRPEVPAEIERIFRRMVAKRPEDRYPRMTELIADLDAWLGHGSSAAATSANLPQEDSKLADFFRTVGSAAKTGSASKVIEAKPATNVDPQQTVAVARNEIGTDPQSQRQLSVAATPPVKPTPEAKPSMPAPKVQRRAPSLPLLLLAGSGGVLVVMLLIGALIFAISGREEVAEGNGSEDAVTPTSTKATTDKPPAGPPLAIAPFDAEQARAHQEAWAKHLGLSVEREVTLPGGAKLTMVLIPPGEFMMGSTDEERAKFLKEAQATKNSWVIERNSSEGPQHRVSITQPFYLGKYEMTQALWQSVMGNNPSQFKDNPSHPVERVSWDDIPPFLAKLNDGSSKAELEFVLPSEAQWEYACRAGATLYSQSGDTEEGMRQYGWFGAGMYGKTYPAGRLSPNSFGLYDMHGNAWEWCADWYAADYYARSPKDDPTGPPSGSSRVIRGGSKSDPVYSGYSSLRNKDLPSLRAGALGFRLAAKIGIPKTNSDATANAIPPTDYALEFNGDGQVLAPNPNYSGDTPLTIECMVCPLAPAKQGKAVMLSAGGLSLQQVQKEGLLAYAYPRERQALTPNYVNCGVRGGTISLNEPCHLAVVFTPKSEPKLFVDGKFRASVHSVATLMSTDVCIGAGNPTSLPFLGRIDEVRISKTARYSKDFTPERRFGPDEHTLALYHFDEGQGDVLVDSSGNNHHGKIIGAKWVQAKPQRADTANYALDFDGRNAFVELPLLKPMPSQAMTLEAIIRPRQKLKQNVITFPHGDGGMRLFQNVSGDKAPSWSFYRGNRLSKATTPVQFDETYHLAGVYDGKQWRLYIGGQQTGVEETKAINAETAGHEASGNWFIGGGPLFQNQPDFNARFDGIIDEVRISNVARYTQNFRPPGTNERLTADSHALALYHFDEGQGDVLVDSSGNNHHGKIVGAKWVNSDGTPIMSPRKYSLAFDGNSRVTVEGFTLAGDQPVTIEAVLTYEDVSEGERSTGVIAGFHGHTNLYYQGNPQRFLQFTVKTPAGLVRLSPGKIGIYRQLRIHLVGERTSTDLKAFVNGKLISSVPFSGDTEESDQVFIIGEGFVGRIEEVRISNTVRYETEFKPSMEFQKDDRTLALYHFDEGQGDVLVDTSGNNHHGKIVGAKWVLADGSPIPVNVSAPPPAVAPFTAEEAKAHQEAWAKYLGKKVVETLDLGQGVTLDLVLIPPGEFLMGSPETEKGRSVNEKQHSVVISQPFYMAITETTQAQYEAVINEGWALHLSAFSEKWAKQNNVEFDKKAWPVDSTNYGMARSFAQKVGGRLPTEAEWEYACRAGTATKYYYGDAFNNDMANVDSGQACPVGKYPPNAFGLRDMHGNVAEWCADYYAAELDDLGKTDPYRAVKLETGDVVRRGGVFSKQYSSKIGSGSRLSWAPNDRHVENGFRIVIPVTLPQKSTEPR